MNDELERSLEGNGRGVVEIVIRYLSVGIEEDHEKPR
jgi:hypothetical protein